LIKQLHMSLYREKILNFKKNFNFSFSNLLKSDFHKSNFSLKSTMYIYMYYLVVGYVIFITINSHYLEYELDEITLIFRRLIVSIVLFVFFSYSFNYDISNFKKFNFFILLLLTSLFFYKSIFLYMCLVLFFVFPKKHQSHANTILYLHIIITILFFTLYTRSFFIEIFNVFLKTNSN
jgi:hypothetical protein